MLLVLLDKLLELLEPIELLGFRLFLLQDELLFWWLLDHLLLVALELDVGSR